MIKEDTIIDHSQWTLIVYHSPL